MNEVEIKSFQWPNGMSQQNITTTIVMDDGIPIDPKAFCRTLMATVKLLESIDKDQNGKLTAEWSVIELAVIGERACFTLHGYDREQLKKAKAEAKTKRKVASK